MLKQVLFGLYEEDGEHYPIPTESQIYGELEKVSEENNPNSIFKDAETISDPDQQYYWLRTDRHMDEDPYDRAGIPRPVGGFIS